MPAVHNSCSLKVFLLLFLDWKIAENCKFSRGEKREMEENDIFLVEEGVNKKIIFAFICLFVFWGV